MAAGVVPSRTPSTVTSTATYVYGVAERGHTQRGSGVVDARVATVEHGSLAAIVSPVPSLNLRAKRRDILAHQGRGESNDQENSSLSLKGTAHPH